MVNQRFGRWSRCGVFAVLSLLVAAPAHATIVPGGGARTYDCLSVFDTPVTMSRNSRQIRCTDGDTTCDADGIKNGECKFSVSVCANDTSQPLCTVHGVQSMFVAHSDDNGDPKFDPDFQALQSRIDNQIDPPNDDANECTTPTNITVRLIGPLPSGRCRQNSKTIKLSTTSLFQSNRFFNDADTLRLTCRAAIDSCDPTSLFTGTFDRIQKQVFNQNCAVSGCHDSQSQAADMLLEVGASYNQIVGVTPSNVTAQGLGWNRITPNDPSTSLMYHKITGDLGAGLGSRMPLGRAPLPSHLIEIMRLWIVAGAPEMGWVPGTDS